MAGPDYKNTDAAVDDMIKKYANSHDITFKEIAIKFFKGVYSYPDDFGMALAVTAGGLGLLGPRAKRNASIICSDVSAIICTLIAGGNMHNLWYLSTKYLEYLETNGRWKGKLASTAGRTVGGFLTSMTFRRVQVEMGIDPRLTFWEARGLSVAMTVLATYGAICNGVIAGERTFVGLLNRIVTGELDYDLGRIDLDFRFDAPWRQRVPNDANEAVRELKDLLLSLCRHNTSVTRG
jgi:hypothetical protein